MRFYILTAILPVAFASWNQELCNGVGGCIGVGVSNENPFRCPDGSAITLPVFTNDLDEAGKPGATKITKEEFPKTCFEGNVPGANATFVRTKMSGGQTAYSFIEESCTDSKPAAPGDCYTYNTNPSTFTFCELVDAKGAQCTENKNAGRCERWGDTAGRDECKNWKIGQPDYPDN